MRYQLTRYNRFNASSGLMDAKPFQEIGDSTFYGDTMENGFPTKGKKFKLANQFLPLAQGQERMFVETSTVIESFPERTYLGAHGSIEHVITFSTRHSEYRLTWFTR
jgi:hypothetical protein